MFLYYFKEAFSGIFRAKLSSFITFIVLTSAILFSAMTVVLIFYSSKIENRIKENVQIRLFIDKATGAEDYEKLMSQIESTGYTAGLKLISREEAAEQLIAETGTDFRGILGENPLPATIVVKLKGEKIKQQNIEEVVTTFTSIEGIESAEYDYSLSLRLMHFLKSAEKVVLGISFFLVILAVYLTYLTNKLINEAKSEQFNTMKLVGAELSTIKVPLYLRGVILGLLSSFVVSIISLFLYSVRILAGIDFTPGSKEKLFFLLTIFICGILFGGGGSILAARGINYKIRIK